MISLKALPACNDYDIMVDPVLPTAIFQNFSPGKQNYSYSNSFDAVVAVSTPTTELFQSAI